MRQMIDTIDQLLILIPADRIIVELQKRLLKFQMWVDNVEMRVELQRKATQIVNRMDHKSFTQSSGTWDFTKLVLQKDS